MRLEELKTLAAWLLAGALVAAGSWASYWAENRNDQYELIWLGWCLHNGGTLYVDCWENKPPGIAWINLLGVWLWPEGQFGAWLLPGVLLSGALLVFWGCVRVVLGWPTARLVLILAAGIGSTRLYDAPSVNPDFYAFVFELMATSFLTLAMTAAGGRGILAASGGGLAFAAATCMKQVGFVGLLAAVVVLVVALGIGPWAARRAQGPAAPATEALRGGPGPRFVFSRVAAAGGAFVFAAGVVAAVLSWQGALTEAWYAMYTYNTRFLPTSAIEQIPQRWPRVVQDLAPLQLWLWLAAVGAIAVMASGSQGTAFQRWAKPWTMFLLFWLVAAGWFAMHGPSMAMRYWQGVWAPMLWLGAAGIEALRVTFLRGERSSRVTLGVLYASVLLMLAAPFAWTLRLGLAEAYLARIESPNERERLTEMGRAIAELVPEGEAIYVWEYEVGPYLYAGRRPASRFTHLRSPESAEEVIEAMEAGLAGAILVPPRQTGFFSRWCTENCQARLAALLERYEESGEIGPYTVFLRPQDSPAGR